MAIQVITRGEYKIAGKVWVVLFGLFLGDEASANTNAQELTSQDDEERMYLAAYSVFLEEDRDLVHPRFKRVVEALLRILSRLLPIPAP